MASDLVSINAVSDSDFDNNHPAGSLLNDVIKFVSYTPYPYIQNNYTETRKIKEQTKIEKVLSQCTKEDFVLLRLDINSTWITEIAVCQLYFIATPTIATKHSLTITILDDAGNTWQSTIAVDFEKK